MRPRIDELEEQLRYHEQNEQLLRRSDELYHLLAENVSDVIWTLDTELRYTYVSPSVERQRGFKAEEVISQSLKDTLSPESYELAKDVFEEELSSRLSGRTAGYRSRTLELEVKRKDGSTFWAEVKVAFLPDDSGQPVGFLGITRDIDKRRKAEHERDRLLQRQQALLENTPALIFLKDEEMKYTAANRAYMEILPPNVKDPIGLRDRDFYSEKAARQFEKEDRQALVDGLTTTKEERIRLRDGRVLDMAITVSPVHGSKGEITGVVGIAFDITERKRTQKELERHSAELERTNEELQRLMSEVRSLSLADELTELYNRRGFMTLAEQQLKIANRTGRAISLFFFDLDNMKKINDSLGHKEGDSALKDTALVLNQTFRESDIIARIGGDEFVVMAVESPEVTVWAFVDRLTENLGLSNTSRKRQYVLSLSMGIAHYDPDAPCSVEALLARADALMYEHKRAKQKSLEK